MPIENTRTWYTFLSKSSKVKFLFVAISGIFLGYSKAPAAADEQRLNLMCLPIMIQTGREHATQCVRLVHDDALRIAPQKQIKGTLTPTFLNKKACRMCREQDFRAIQPGTCGIINIHCVPPINALGLLASNYFTGHMCLNT